MASARRKVLVSKVLARLYPEDISYTPKLQLPTLPPENKEPSTRHEHVEDLQLPTQCITGCKKESLANPRIYTVSLPPEDYVPGSLNECKSSSTEESANQEDLEGDLLIRKRKRRRRKKKTNVTPPLAPENEHKSSEIANPSLTSVHEPINKNKRRKLQRKRQKERVKAAGLWKKSSEDSVAHKNEADELGRGTLAHTSESHTEEDLKKMSHDLLDFLQATQEIYFADGKSKCTDSALSDSVILEILQQIESGELPSSDIIHLHHIKSLLRLQDIERLKDVLDNFKVHSSLPDDPGCWQDTHQWNRPTDAAFSLFTRNWWDLPLPLQHTSDD